MATAFEAEHTQGKAWTGQNTEGSLHSPAAAMQLSMDPWTLRFKDERAEVAHQATRAKSPSLLFVLSIFNAVCLGGYCAGVILDCKTIRANSVPLLLVNMPYQAIETYFYLLSPGTGKAGRYPSPESLKLVWVCIQIFGVGLRMWAQVFSNDMGGSCDNDASSKYCSQIGLAANGNGAICFVLVPYVTHSSLTLKMYISGGLVMFHAVAPFWPASENEISAICSSVAVGNAIGYVLEHSLRSIFREQYARQADQELLMQMKVAANMRLTHTIKGKCGISNGLAVAVISCLKRIRIAQVERAVQLVHRMRFLLEEAEWWCNHRQLCVHLELGTYQSKRTMCDVRARIKKLVGFDGVVDKCAFVTCNVDTTVLGLAMDEALSNARQFRCAGTKFAISMQIDEDDGVNMLHVQMDSTNRANVPFLTAEQCSRVVQSGYKKHNISAFSDGVGLANVQQAAHAIGGRIWLQGYSTSPRLNHTVFHFVIPVDGIVWRHYDEKSDAENEDREAPLELPAVWSEEYEEEGTQRDEACTADQAQDLSAAAASETGNGEAFSPLALPAGVCSVDDSLVCLGLDDSIVCRQLHELMFADFLDADMSRSSSLGASIEEVESFVDLALGLKTADLTIVPEGERRAVDVVLIDQHLLVEDKRWLGSDIAQTLRARGFGGVICVMSGTVSDHLQELQQQEVIDMAFSKGASPLDIAETIHKLHEENTLAARRSGAI